MKKSMKNSQWEGAFYTGVYRNLFAEAGIGKEEIEQRKREIFHTLFYGEEEERLYHPAGEDMGYIEDTGNHDVRTEGMSYGMMMCVQMDRKEEFDRLWKWAKTYMYMEEGENKGYFAWSCRTTGEKNAWGAAPDGEEYFAMSLFFASHRWGDGEGIFDYAREAKELLSACIHKGEAGEGGRAMWDRDRRLIRFVCEVDFSDPSYHLPHFYELFARWAYPEDREFFREAAEASREYLKKACHPLTGLSAEYAEFDGSPYLPVEERWGGRHDWHYSDAYRTIANIALDYVWFAADGWAAEEAAKVQKFFYETLGEGQREGIYAIDGAVLPGKALHPLGLFAANVQGGLALWDDRSLALAETFFKTPLRRGDRRYYDNCLYFFAFLALSGNYRIY